VPMHAVAGLVMGLFMAIAWRDYRQTDYVALSLAVVVPVIFHFGYDFPLFLHNLNPHLRWPTEIFPAIMLFEGIFAMLVTDYALNGVTAIYDARVASDPSGRRAAVFAGIMVMLVVTFMVLTLEFPNAINLPLMAVMPFVLALDLTFTAIIRLAPAR
jgi:hypothetical protein